MENYKGFKLSVELEGYEKLLSTLDGSELEELMEAIELEIENTQQLVFTESQVLVPVDTSLLKQSGRPEPITRDSNGIEALITYNTHYAVWVHERMELRHNAPTQAKFLEKPMREQASHFTKALREILETYFGGAK